MTDVKTLLNEKPFGMPQKRKEEILLALIKESISNNFNNAFVSSLYQKSGFNIDSVNSLEDIPFIHASSFKEFDLSTVEKDKIIRVLTSSSTTGQVPSKVPLDKETSLRQSIALKTILSDYLGKKRMPMLIFDVESMNPEAQQLAARGAGIRGFSNFASEMHYLVMENGKLSIDMGLLKELNDKYQNELVFMFGFTYLLWELVSKEHIQSKFNFKKMKIFHGGGWKKLENKKVSKDTFSKNIAEFFGCPESNIYDFYGMVEEAGVIFIDCEAGFKHVPIFADLLIRDFYSLEPMVGKEGLVNIINAIPTSYPGQSVITDDKGIIFGIDDCKCGRKGKYFKFTSRVIKSEVRGCGDARPDIK